MNIVTKRTFKRDTEYLSMENQNSFTQKKNYSKVIIDRSRYKLCRDRDKMDDISECQWPQSRIKRKWKAEKYLNLV